MGRRRRGGRGRHGFKIPVITTAIIIGQAMVANASSTSLAEKLNTFQGFYTGIDLTPTGQFGGFQPAKLIVGWGPWLAKGLITRVARPMGAVPRVPFGLPISIS